MKRVLTILLACVLLCGAAGSAMAEEAPVKLTWFVDVPSFVFNSEGWGIDRMTAEFTEKFGIEIEFVVAADDSGSQLATLISSDSVPDIITVEGLWNAQDTELLPGNALEQLVDAHRRRQLYTLGHAGKLGIGDGRQVVGFGLLIFARQLEISQRIEVVVDYKHVKIAHGNQSFHRVVEA